MKKSPTKKPVRSVSTQELASAVGGADTVIRYATFPSSVKPTLGVFSVENGIIC